ncbi:type VI secretion system Vgr family protein [Mesoterricola silvestris]|uniref:Gp5/Type VI secretion system Vgr protein OB-fold domain-containing protein n=1 Tax=Mesoterricola silvestris TaxID=2927979 RepID=A0AA48K9P9_9BACT|nr:type VI secretion system tip protein TssI/VgrG [Mesoterricola silvestris]BDU73731.1 hypothetical protein METEAL_29050 [Mesoterricola silvestris]
MELLSQKKYSFHTGALPENALAVVHFTGDEGISRLYAFDLDLLSRRLDLNLQDLLNKPATFTIHRPSGGDVAFKGMLSEFEQLGEFDGHGFYRARLVPRLWWLSITRHNQVFLDRTVPEILREVLVEGGLTSADFEFRLKGDYPPREFVCQYRESHFDFLSRWLEREGICYFFEQGRDGEKVVFVDDLAGHKEAPQGRRVAYAPASGLDALAQDETLKTFACRSQVIPSKVLLKDHDYLKPSLELEGKAEVDADGKGQVYLYGEHFHTPGEGERLARLRKEELLCRRNRVRGTGSAPFLAPGFTFQVERHFREDYNRTYLAVEVHHEGSQAGAFTSGLQKALAGLETAVFYRNDFVAIPSDVQFRPPQDTPAPRISGTLTARIDAAGAGQFAELDLHGRYKVVLPFDLSGRKDAKASAYLRMAQPYAGSDHGMHFPLHKDTEVLLTFLEGDPDSPVIAAAVPNAATPSVVLGANATQNRIVSSAGNEILLEDKAGSERILIFDKTYNNCIRLGAPDTSDTEMGARVTSRDSTGIVIFSPQHVWIESPLMDTLRTNSKGDVIPDATTITGSASYAGEIPTERVIKVHEVDAAAKPPTVRQRQDADLTALHLAAAAYNPPDAQPLVTQLKDRYYPAPAAQPPSPTVPATPPAPPKPNPTLSFMDGTTFSFTRTTRAFTYAKGPSYAVVCASPDGLDQDDSTQCGGPGNFLPAASGALTYKEKPGKGCGDWDGIAGSLLGAMAPGDTVVSKRYGNSYSYADGPTFTVTRGDSQTITLEGRQITQAYTLTSGGSRVVKTAETINDNGVVTTTAWDSILGTMTSISYNNRNGFIGTANFPLVPQLSLTQTISPSPTVAISNNVGLGSCVAITGYVGAQATIALYASAVANITYGKGVKFDLTINPITLAYDDVTKEFELKVPGVKAKDQNAMDIEDLKVALANTQINLNKVGVDLHEAGVALRKASARISSGIHIYF